MVIKRFPHIFLFFQRCLWSFIGWHLLTREPLGQKMSFRCFEVFMILFVANIGILNLFTVQIRAAIEFELLID